MTTVSTAFPSCSSQRNLIVPSSADCCFLSTRGAERVQRSESSCRSARGRFVISSHEPQPAENQRKSCFARYAGCPSEPRYSASSSGSMDFISIFSVSSAISSHTAIEKAVRIIFLRQYEPLLLADKVRMIVKKPFRNILVFLMENGAGGIKKDPTRPDARGKRSASVLPGDRQALWGPYSGSPPFCG